MIRKKTDKVTAEAMALPPRSRARLADRLLASLNDRRQELIISAWAREAEDRIDAFERGQLRTIPGAEVFRTLKARKRG